jgi:hypothetical protein
MFFNKFKKNPKNTETENSIFMPEKLKILFSKLKINPLKTNLKKIKLRKND